MTLSIKSGCCSVDELVVVPAVGSSKHEGERPATLEGEAEAGKAEDAEEEYSESRNEGLDTVLRCKEA